VGPRAGFDVLKERKVAYTYRDSIPGPSIPQPGLYTDSSTPTVTSTCVVCSRFCYASYRSVCRTRCPLISYVCFSECLERFAVLVCSSRN
jgi:hypothetical protein